MSTSFKTGARWIRMNRISPEGWGLRYDAVEDGDGRNVRLRMRIRVPDSSGTLDAELQVRIAAGGQRPVTLSVPVVASVFDAGGSRTIADH